MFSKQSSALLTQQFWTSFGQYMAPVPSAEGQKINWINYKTGVKDIHFKMQADSSGATIAIVLMHTDSQRQVLVFKQFEALGNLLRDALQEDWQWQMLEPDKNSNNKIISLVSTALNGVSIYRKEDWPAIISFFKPRIIALDAFWAACKYALEE